MTPKDFNIYSWSNQEILAEIGTRIRRHRHFLRLTQKELAEKSGVGEHTLKRLESRRAVNVSFATLLDLFRALGVLDHVLEIIPDIGLNPYNISPENGKEVQRIRKTKA